MSFSGLDFNLRSPFCVPAKKVFAGHDHAYGQAGFRAGVRAVAAEHFSGLHGSVQRRAQDQAHNILVQIVAAACTRSTREPARHKGVFISWSDFRKAAAPD